MTGPIENKSSVHTELKLTADGSHTLFVPLINEHYHSVFGAIQESRHIFINAGLNALPENLPAINILEIGFGTGLNALLTCLEKRDSAPCIRYLALERYPLPIEMTSQLNYPDRLQHVNASDIFLELHIAEWNKWAAITEMFVLFKLSMDIHDFTPEKEMFDLVYFDAFGPEVQPEMWTPEVFGKMYMALNRGGILVTYSCKGMVKRNLKGAGFSLEKLPGPPGKREMLRATK